MNQILSVDNHYKKEKTKKVKTKNSGPIEIQNILKFFAISLLVFGIFVIGSGSYSMYKVATQEENKTKPVINLENNTEEEIQLKISHDKNLAKVTYQWNNEAVNDIPCSGKQEIEETIMKLEGTNTLKVYAKDIKGQEIEYSQVYTLEEAININVEVEGSNLKIAVNGMNQLQYMTYRWDEEEETKIDINDIETEQIIEIPKGLHTLTVIVVDENNRTETKEQEVNGVTKPKLDVTTDGSSNFLINAEDEQGIKRVEFFINGTQYNLDLDKVLPLEERKKFEYSYPLEEGRRNELEVKVYNESGVSETFKAFVNM